MTRVQKERAMAAYENLILNTDNYKHCHYALYPEGTEYVSSYIESRGGAYPVTMFVGLQAFIREYLMQPITLEQIDEAEFHCREIGMPFRKENWLGILNDHGGFLPVEIEAAPEGVVMPARNVLVQTINTDPKYYWATSFFETALLRAVWYPTTIGTISWMAKQVIKRALDQTSDNPGVLRHTLHDYGARGVSSRESAALGGLAHLVNFNQSDTVPGVTASKKYYNHTAPALSGPNSEHASFTAWGVDGETAAMRNMIERYRHYGVVILLTDSYDHEHAVKNIIGGELKELIKAGPGLIGVRPDSGDPVQVTCDTTEWLMESFGYTINAKGYKILPDYIRTVQGDGITLESLRDIYVEMARRGLAADNAVFGMGGGLLQHCNRDTMNFAQKTSAVQIKGNWVDVFKRPTGAAFKASKRGRLALQFADGEYRTVVRDSIPAAENLLQPVFRNGKLLKLWNFSDLIAQSERPVPDHYTASFLSPMLIEKIAAE
jgi:nicotinamide phosphoribosyltransferase